jgi:methylated-DNA-[protein]-cysteine S-methyltransferase
MELTIDTPMGLFCAVEEDGQLVELSPRCGGTDETELLLKVKQQLEEYFSGTRQRFELPLAPRGTDFRQRVWLALGNIPYGETRTYGEIARAVGSEKASRAVGMACKCNPIPIIIPCHRVVGAAGKLTGYALGLEMKQALLALEKKFI